MIELGGIQKHMTLVGNGIVDLASSFFRKNNQIIVIGNDIRDSGSVAHERSVIKVNKVRVHNVNHLLFRDGFAKHSLHWNASDRVCICTNALWREDLFRVSFERRSLLCFHDSLCRYR